MNDALRPDRTEEELGTELDAMVPTRGYRQVPVVGLGGSAGGIEALREFFAAMPAGSGLAFIVVMHLPQEHESVLPEVLQRCTRLPNSFIISSLFSGTLQLFTKRSKSANFQAWSATNYTNFHELDIHFVHVNALSRKRSLCLNS